MTKFVSILVLLLIAFVAGSWWTHSASEKRRAADRNVDLAYSTVMQNPAAFTKGLDPFLIAEPKYDDAFISCLELAWNTLNFVRGKEWRFRLMRSQHSGAWEATIPEHEKPVRRA